MHASPNPEPRKAPELTLSRVFDAPRPLVWKAWTRPEHLARWWGPRGFALPRCDQALRAGGAFALVMRGPDGRDYPYRGEFREVVEPERLVSVGVIHDLPGHVVETTVTFAEEGEQTRVTVHQVYSFETDATRGAREGWGQSLDRLGELLGIAGRELVATRLLDAPRDLVWRAWSEPEHLARWWGPDGFRNTFQELDFRPGGRWRFVMHGPDGTDYRNESVFVEIAPTHLIVLDHSAPRFRLAFHFADEGGGTRVTMAQRFETPEARERVRSFAEPGNEQNLRRLEAEVAAMR